MKKISKLFLVFLLVVTLVIPSFGSTFVVFAEDPIASIGSEISIIGMPDNGTVGSALNIPKGTSPDGTVITKIYDPKGSMVFDSSIDTLPNGPGNTYSFNPQFLAGEYSVTYSVVMADETVKASVYSNEYKIMVTGDRATFEFSNSDILLPETTNYDYEIVLPYPTVYDSNGDVVALATVAGNIVILVKKPDSTSLVLSDVDIEGTNYKAFTPLLADGEGIYTIDYSYTDIITNLTTNQSFELVVAEGFDPEDIFLTETLGGSMPESAVLGNEVELPQVILRDENTGNELVNAYVEITVEYSGEGTVENPEVVDFMFTPVVEGDYTVTYTIYDFFTLADAGDPIEIAYDILNVSDTEAPEVMAVADYDAVVDMDNASYDFVDVDYLIPSNIAVGDSVNFPAIHGTDNITLSSALTYKRAIVDASNTIIDLDVEAPGSSMGETVAYTFLVEGTYTVKYYAIDEENNEEIISYVLKVIDGYVDNSAPTIDVSSLPNYSNLGDTIKFLAPSVVDYVEGESDIADERVEVKVYYYLGDADTALVAIEADEEDGYLSFVVPADMVEPYLHVYIEAIDDGLNNASGVNTETYLKQIGIMDSNDLTAPNFIGDEPTLVGVDQDSIVTLDAVKFTDNNPTFVSVGVKIETPSGGLINLSSVQIEFEEDDLSGSDADGIVISGGKFTASLAGNYRITYTATDAAGNSFIKSYTQYVNDTKAPNFNLNPINTNIEVGETIILPTPTIIDNGVEIENQALTQLVFIDSPAYILTLANNEFTPLEEGIYSFKYLAEDESGNTSESAVYTVTAEDSINPIITLDDTMIFPLTAPLTRADEEDPYDPITVPGFTAYDLNGLQQFYIEIKSPIGNVILEEYNGENQIGGNYQFVPIKDGSYTVTYFATDLAGNTTSDIRVVKVGDNAAPTITIGNTTVNKPGNKTVGDTITLDMTTITVTDTKDGDIELDDITANGESKFITILTAPNGSVVNPITSGEYDFDLTESGDYTLTYTARDEAGNIKVETTVFQVVADELDVTSVTQTWGTILIVISLIVLAGVVFYFIRSRELVDDED
jgi:hypothetical protein